MYYFNYGNLNDFYESTLSHYDIKDVDEVRGNYTACL